MRIRIPQQEVSATHEHNTFTLSLRRAYKKSKTAPECDSEGGYSLLVHGIDVPVRQHRKRGDAVRQQLQRTRIATQEVSNSEKFRNEVLWRDCQAAQSDIKNCHWHQATSDLRA